MPLDVVFAHLTAKILIWTLNRRHRVTRAKIGRQYTHLHTESHLQDRCYR